MKPVSGDQISAVAGSLPMRPPWVLLPFLAFLRRPQPNRRWKRPRSGWSRPAICLAPQYLAEELLRLEGFSQVEYVSS